ncbi:methyltransferase [Paracoccus sp. 1_MG-2023]|uniref:methyltransferase family protein n=1 Tax=unclassified Paracoccus (in: a-proteobacteria) TaxID=2688777 RepID=UPI001C099B53|nr:MULTISPECIES: methyltransferase [unclassified Paracoccus (in: a-proteobacteria)]MBU2956715.1 isoprenylcysteine carboxylmethyltransferase family protein [Paracoccus sp. C2R09]MDO6669245.1 methyltransferase [Paracoccus sp. 1_MG-2023]
MRLTADYPPIWLAGFAGAAWLFGRVLPPGPDWLVWPGRLLVALGLLLMAWAAVTMMRARTTVDPHGAPRALVTGGPFAMSRNPIYLGDILILLGLSLSFGAWIAALPLAWGFMRVISARFITPEEARLSAAFPADFPQYKARTGRWI